MADALHRTVPAHGIILCAIAAALAAGVPSASFADGEGCEAYVGASGTLAFRQGGGRVGGGDVRVGAYVSDCWALETDAGWHEDYAFLSMRGIMHLSALETYDRFFGYSRFDPFFMLGGGCWTGGFRQCGPLAGMGAFWHLDDNWSVRVDASAMLGLDGECGMLYSVSAGLQYSFGGQ